MADDVLPLLEELPDAIARASSPIVFPADRLPDDPGRRRAALALLEALGVAVVERLPRRDGGYRRNA